jgi:hypothetical protein
MAVFLRAPHLFRLIDHRVIMTPRNFGTRHAPYARRRLNPLSATSCCINSGWETTTVEKTATQERLEVGVFTTVEDARRAVNGLLGVGFSKDKITVVCSDETKERYFREFEHQEPAGTYTPTATIAGGTIGAILGGATVIASAVATGSLALWAAGPITAWAGGVAGGLVGAMMTRGVEKELANFYQQAVIDGQILVAAESSGTGPPLSKAARILKEAGAKPLTLPEG